MILCKCRPILSKTEHCKRLHRTFVIICRVCEN